jgi:hypothetical protein
LGELGLTPEEEADVVAFMGIYESSDAGLIVVPIALRLINRTGPDSASCTWLPANLPSLGPALSFVGSEEVLKEPPQPTITTAHPAVREHFLVTMPSNGYE